MYGLVTVSSPSLIFGASHTVEEVIKKDVESEDSAETQEIASEIKNGTISPKDQKHYEAGLLQIQKQGIKGISFYYLLNTPLAAHINHTTVWKSSTKYDHAEKFREINALDITSVKRVDWTEEMLIFP